MGHDQHQHREHRHHAVAKMATFVGLMGAAATAGAYRERGRRWIESHAPRHHEDERQETGGTREDRHEHRARRGFARHAHVGAECRGCACSCHRD